MQGHEIEAELTALEFAPSEDLQEPTSRSVEHAAGPDSVCCAGRRCACSGCLAGFAPIVRLMGWTAAQLAGTDYLAAVTALLRRIRLQDPLGNVLEAADLQWWWRIDQHRDPTRQTFWFDDDGEPIAATIVTDWRGDLACDAFWSRTMTPHAVEVMWPQLIAMLETLDTDHVDLRIDDTDTAVLDRLADARLVVTDDAAEVTTALPADRRPNVSPLPAGYRLTSRAETGDRPHHMIARSGTHVAERLAECSIYRPDLDLAIENSAGDVVAYGLFWADDVTGIGLVEPMRTEDAYQGRGFARHVLTTGLERLAAAGSKTFKVTYLDDNPMSRRLYLSAGFTAMGRACTYRWSGRPT